MYLHSIASSFPPHRLTQKEAWAQACDSETVQALKGRSRKVLEKVLLGDSGIETRHFAVDDPTRLFDLEAGELNELFEKEAPAMTIRALEKALDKAQLKPTQLDALFLCTCTGYLCPGVTSYAAEAMGMRPDIYLNDVVGLGCGAAVPTLRAAHGFLAANPDAVVAVVAVETCSSAFFINDDLGVLISLCLFGDGCSASIWKGSPGSSGFHAENFATLHVPEEREKIRFVNDGGKLKNKLDRSVPQLAGKAVKQLYGERFHNEPYVLTHTGGRDVIDAIESECDLDSIEESRGVLRDCGNTSSPSVMIALERYLENVGELNDHLGLTSFGAGFACHSFEMNR